MSHITLNGASIEADFVRGFKKFEAFIKEMDGKIPDWIGNERGLLLKKVWDIANEIEVKVQEEIEKPQPNTKSNNNSNIEATDPSPSVPNSNKVTETVTE